MWGDALALFFASGVTGHPSELIGTGDDVLRPIKGRLGPIATNFINMISMEPWRPTLAAPESLNGDQQTRPNEARLGHAQASLLCDSSFSRQHI